MSNIKFNYLYRDGSNYTSWAEIVFGNPNDLSLLYVDKNLRSFFEQDGLFIASRIRIPEVFLYLKGSITEFDHCYHEFFSVESSDEIPTDSRTINTFLGQVKLEAKIGWRAFDPLTRYLLHHV
jgi:hypothetical protein